MTKFSKTMLAAATAGLLLPAFAHSQVNLLIDFGATEAIDDLTNSPFHQELGAAADSFTTWNTLGATTSGNLLAADTGLQVANYEIVTGRSTGGVISWDAVPGTLNNNALGTSSTYQTGVYSGNSVGKDGLFYTQGDSTSPGVLGVVIGGLAAGDYQVYVMAGNTNSIANTQLQTITAASIDAMHPAEANFSDSQTGKVQNYGSGQSVSYHDADTSAWLPDVNYTVLTVSLSDNENLLISSMGYAGTGETRPFMNAVMITPVPEPSTYAGIAGLCVLGFVVVRRAVRQRAGC